MFVCGLIDLVQNQFLFGQSVVDGLLHHILSFKAHGLFLDARHQLVMDRCLIVVSGVALDLTLEGNMVDTYQLINIFG